MLQAGRHRVRMLAAAKDFFFCIQSKVTTGPNQTSLQWVPGLFHGVRRPGREVDPSPSSNGEVKKEWGYTSTSLYVFMT